MTSRNRSGSTTRPPMSTAGNAEPAPLQVVPSAAPVVPRPRVIKPVRTSPATTKRPIAATEDITVDFPPIEATGTRESSEGAGADGVGSSPDSDSRTGMSSSAGGLKVGAEFNDESGRSVEVATEGSAPVVPSTDV